MTDNTADRLLAALRGLGIRVSEDDETAVLIAIEAHLDEAGELRAAEALHVMRDILRDTPAGAALDRVLFGAVDSLRDDAQRTGVSHTTIRRHERKIRGRLPRMFQAP